MYIYIVLRQEFCILCSKQMLENELPAISSVLTNAKEGNDHRRGLTVKPVSQGEKILHFLNLQSPKASLFPSTGQANDYSENQCRPWKLVMT
jgi:hypothetical protein